MEIGGLVDGLVEALAEQAGLSAGAWKAAMRAELGDAWGRRPHGTERAWGFTVRDDTIWSEERFDVVDAVTDPSRQLSPAEVASLGTSARTGDIVGIRSEPADLDALETAVQRAVLRWARPREPGGATQDVEEVFRAFSPGDGLDLVLFSVYRFLRVVHTPTSPGEISLEAARETADADLGELIGFRDDEHTRRVLVALMAALDEPIVRP